MYHSARLPPLPESWPAGKEPPLAEILGDPLVHLVMRRDRVTQAQLRCVIALAQCRLRGGLCPDIAA
jgi:hypothetical protein